VSQPGQPVADAARQQLEAVERELGPAWNAASGLAERSRIASELIARLYAAYYRRARSIPTLAQEAFETLNWQRSLELSRERIAIFGLYRDLAIEWFRRRGERPDADEAFWEAAYSHHLKKIAGTYQGDVAYAFLTSIRRSLTHDQWRVVDYSYARATGARRPPPGERPAVYREFPFTGPITPALVGRLLDVPKFAAAFRDRAADAGKVARRFNAHLAPGDHQGGVVRAIDAGFFRNRGAYIVGKVEQGQRPLPFAIALLNDERGITVDALVTESDRLHYIFSSSLANFHATNPNFHELVDALFGLMPKRPRGLHYSTIGFNHVGKLAVMRQIETEMAGGDAVFDYAPGPRGSVAIGFTAPKLRYVLKVVRDHPTEHYKWGTFPGVDDVLGKYRQVHEINRAGSMLDNVIYDNAALDPRRFSRSLADELLAAAGSNVASKDGNLVFRHLIVQLKMVPLPEYFKTADIDQARQAVSSLGRCIRNNAAANIFNKDLDGRNYGVSQTQRVYLFDYDAVERFTEVKIRTNLDRIDGEEDVPDWFFEDGYVFLPEEIELHLRIEDRALRQQFRAEHGDLLTPAFWQQMQTELRTGRVPKVSTYPDECRL